MKSTWVRGFLILLTFFSLALKENDIVELEAYFNARYSANFLKSTSNVKFVVPPGTRAQIGEIKKFNSGNYGLQVTLQNGKNQGQKVWLYYNKKSPSMKFFEGEEADSSPTQEIEKAKSAETTVEQPGLRSPDGMDLPLVIEDEKATAEKVVKKIEHGQQQVDVVESKNQKVPCDDECKLAQDTYMRKGVGEGDRPSRPEGAEPELPPVKESTNTLKTAVKKKAPAPQAAEVILPQPAPVRPVIADQEPGSLRPFPNTENRKPLAPRTCRSPSEDLAYCSQEGFGVTGIEITNYANRNPGRAPVYRKWSVSAPGAARQDASIWVTDDFGGSNSTLQESMILVFPRVSMPSVRSVGSKNVVTLPNGETISFEKGSGKIVGGVFSEQALVKGQSPRVTYQGKGLTIRANSKGADPRLGSTATVSKQGRTCTVQKKDLWNQSSSGGQRFKYFSDKDLDAYLKSKCGFGI